MALRFQNLFSSENDDFDDEDFLSALDNTEENVLYTVPSGLRSLRPISHAPAKCTDEPKSQVPPPPPWHQKEVEKHDQTQRTFDLAQDMDDEELLSVCSMLEVPQEAGQSMSVGSAGNSSSSLRLCPTGKASVGFQAHDPRSSYKGAAVCQPGTYQMNSVGANSPSPLQIPSKGTEHFQSPGPTAKRPCRRDMIDPQSVTPHRVETQSHCTPSVQLRPVVQGLSSTSQPWRGGTLHRNSPVSSAQNVHTTPKAPLISPRPLIPNSLQTPVVTNHLVQLVTAANQTPRRLSWETPPPKERRFPGPAGLLPQQGSTRGLDEILVSTPHTPAHGARAKLGTKTSMASPQPIEEEFGRGPWAALKAELALDENDPSCFLRTYSVVMVLRKAALKQLPKNKVPRMAVALKSLTPANGDASAVFRDHTGDIQGTVHHLLLEEKESDLKVGSVLLLQQVGVFSPSHRNHYLNVTPNNLVRIYPPEAEGPHTRLETPPVASEQTDLNSNRVRSPARPSAAIRTAGAAQPSSLGEWDMDDLDSLLCDLSEDTGD
ncbi:homologous recombination OB-fold protein isoform X2 [Xenopus laevis]|uniref:Homologous recombination OB-fold protein isoform X2 n=2 Tax=Xenopus laevis TaxID=8355 RepID=A0A8J1LUN0_XENLA|nr:homologous recombination OB-fold protein isoform X2 [Xenopus laevis]